MDTAEPRLRRYGRCFGVVFVWMFRPQANASDSFRGELAFASRNRGRKTRWVLFSGSANKIKSRTTTSLFQPLGLLFVPSISLRGWRRHRLLMSANQESSG